MHNLILRTCLQIIFGHSTLQLFYIVKQEVYFTGYSSLTISEACSKTGASIWLNLHLQGNNIFNNNCIFRQNLHMFGQHRANHLNCTVTKMMACYSSQIILILCSILNSLSPTLFSIKIVFCPNGQTKTKKMIFSQSN